MRLPKIIMSALTIVLSLISVTSCDNTEPEYAKSTSEESSFAHKAQYAKYRILAIGNSFTKNATEYIPQLMNEKHEEDVFFCRLMKGGTSLQELWELNEEEKTSMEISYAHKGLWYLDTTTYLENILKAAEWDIITIQQLSNFSGQAESYQPYLDNIIELCHSIRPKAKIVWHMTWSYSATNTQEAFAQYDRDPEKMLQAIIESYETYKDKFDLMIPSGIMIQNLRNTEWTTAADLTKDGYHLDEGLPCFALSCLWHEKLITPFTGIPTKTTNVRPNKGKVGVSDEAAEYIYQMIESL